MGKNNHVSEELHARFFTMDGIGVWELYQQEKIISLSQTACDILGIAEKNQSLDDFYTYFSVKDALQETIQSAIAGGTGFRINQTISANNGLIEPIEISGMPRYHDGKIIGLYGTLKKDAHDPVNQENEYYSAIYENNVHAVFTVDKDSKIKKLNKAGRTLISCSDTKCLGHKLTDYITDDYQKIVTGLINRAFKGEINEEEIEFISSTENMHFGNLSVIPAESGGKIEYVHGFFVDTTENKKLQNLLLEEENLLESIITNLPTFFFLFDTNGKFFRWNKNLEKVTGYSGNEVAQMHPVTFFDTDQVAPITGAIEEVFTKGTTSIESEVLTKSGEKIPYFFFAARIMYKGKVCLAGYGIDISERKEAEIELKKSERRFKSLVQDSNDLIAIIDRQGFYKYVSPSTKPILGFTPESFEGKNVFEFISGKDTERLGLILESLASGKSVQIEPYRFIDSDGNWRWLETMLTNKEHEPSIAGFVANTRDITKLKEHEEKLKLSLEEKEVLLSEIHHRVKNNLAVVSGMIEMQALEEEDDDIIDKLLDSTYRIQAMANIHELLYQSANYSQLTFTEIIKKLINGIQKTLQGNKKVTLLYITSEFDLNVNQAIPLSLILNEVITNIYKHAFKKKKSGKIHIISKKENDTVSLEIRDNGVGLPENFDLHNTTSLGINIINILSRQLEATHTFTNRDTGTSFKISFKRKNVRGAGNALITRNML